MTNFSEEQHEKSEKDLKEIEKLKNFLSISFF